MNLPKPRLLVASVFRSMIFSLFFTAACIVIPYCVWLAYEYFVSGTNQFNTIGTGYMIVFGALFLMVFIPLLSLFNLLLHFTRLAPFILSSKLLLSVEIALYIGLFIIFGHLRIIGDNEWLLIATPFITILFIAIIARILKPSRLKRKLDVVRRRQLRYYKCHPSELTQTADIILCFVITLFVPLILFIPFILRFV